MNYLRIEIRQLENEMPPPCCGGWTRHPDPLQQPPSPILLLYLGLLGICPYLSNQGKELGGRIEPITSSGSNLNPSLRIRLGVGRPVRNSIRIPEHALISHQQHDDRAMIFMTKGPCQHVSKFGGIAGPRFDFNLQRVSTNSADVPNANTAINLNTYS